MKYQSVEYFIHHLSSSFKYKNQVTNNYYVLLQIITNVHWNYSKQLKMFNNSLYFIVTEKS